MSQREKYIMGYTIVSGNKPSPVTLHQKACNNIDRNALIKCQIFVLNINIPKTKWDGAEEPTINKFFKINSRKIIICSLNCRLTEAKCSISYQPK